METMEIVNGVLTVLGILTGGVFLAPPKVAKAINIIGKTANAVSAFYRHLEHTEKGFTIKQIDKQEIWESDVEELVKEIDKGKHNIGDKK